MRNVIKDYPSAIRLMEQFRRPAGAEGDEAKARKRQRIVAAATALFIHHGYRKTSIDDVADAAGIAKGTVYLYFKTKADLLLQAILDEKLRFGEAMRPIFEADVPARERLRLLFRIGLTLPAKMPLTGRLLTGDREILAVLADMDPTMLRASEEVQDAFIADLLAAATNHGRPTRELRERARVLLGLLLSATFLDERTRRGLSPERFADVLADIVVDGVAPLPAATTRR